jgi:hypothetical protein
MGPWTQRGAQDADQLRAVEGVTGSSRSGVSDLDETHSTNGRHQWTGPWTWAVAAAAILLVIGLGSAFVVAGGGGRPLRTNPTTSPTSSVWRLVSSVGPEVRPFESTGDNPQGLHSLTCPTARICYLISSPSSTGGFPDAAIRSMDGGMSWLPISLPSGVFLDTSFSCVNGTDCMVGAEAGIGSAVNGSNVAQLLLATNDGGASWITHQVPMPPIMGADAALNQTISSLQGRLYDLHCFSSKSCVAFGTTPADQAEGGSDGKDPISQTVAMRTGDGGTTWSTYVFPWSTTPSGAPGWSNEQRATFSCPTEQSCVGLATVLAAVDYSHTFQVNGSTYRGGQASSLLEFRTSDGGANWSQSWVSGVQAFVETLTCPDQNHCFAVAQIGEYAPPGPTEVLTTSDGGATWEPRQLFPSQNPGWDSVSSISCPSVAACWIAGSEQSSTDPSHSEGAMFATQDGGQTWLPVQLPTGLGSVNQVDCVSARSCLAIGQPPISNGPVTSSGPIPSFVLTNRGRNR